MKTKHSFFSLTLSLGLALALLWLVNGGLQPARADATPVHYVATTGSDSGDCSNSVSPCRTVQYAVDQAGAGDEVRVAAGVYSDVSARPRQDITTTGVVTQVVYLAKSVTVRGGYTTADWDTSDPEAHPTTLNAGGQGRVIYITGDITPTVEGVIITGGDATMYQIGGGILIWDADATISNCHIYSNTASAVIYGGGGGLYLHQSHATLSHNVVQSNTACVSGIGAGGGLYLDQSDAVLNGNTIAHNGAQGVYIYLETSLRNTITRNSIVANGQKGIGIVFVAQPKPATPLITEGAYNYVEGEAPPGSIVEIFSGPDDEGMYYEGTVTAGEDGTFRLDAHLRGRYATATSTDATGTTSEFSEEYEVQPLWRALYLPIVFHSYAAPGG